MDETPTKGDERAETLFSIYVSFSKKTTKKNKNRQHKRRRMGPKLTHTIGGFIDPEGDECICLYVHGLLVRQLHSVASLSSASAAASERERERGQRERDRGERGEREREGRERER